MPTQPQEKYGNADRPDLRVVRGGQWGRPRNRRGLAIRSAPALAFDRVMHEAFVSWADAQGRVPSRAVQEIREGRQHPWRLLVRRFEEARRAGVPKVLVKRVIAALDHFVDRLYDQQQPPRAA